jgi:flagellar hook-length control protein FliK
MMLTINTPSSGAVPLRPDAAPAPQAAAGERTDRPQEAGVFLGLIDVSCLARAGTPDAALPMPAADGSAVQADAGDVLPVAAAPADAAGTATDDHAKAATDKDAAAAPQVDPTLLAMAMPTIVIPPPARSPAGTGAAAALDGASDAVLSFPLRALQAVASQPSEVAPVTPLAAHADAAATASALPDASPALPDKSALPAWITAAAQAQQAPVSGDAVKLAGTPQQWQQPLRAALGDHLQLQIGRQAEQAVIRLEPPMLGHIDIAIRHSAGALQVSISASHADVAQQLQAISTELRVDLAQRQYNSVSVEVAAAPRHSAAGSGFADGGSRQRQQANEQTERQPGRALSDGGNTRTAFALHSDQD